MTAKKKEEQVALVDKYPSATKQQVQPIERIPFGIPSLDFRSGGGVPKGRITEIYGWESSSKTTIALYAAKTVTQNKEKVFFIDLEHALDPSLLEIVGVDLEHFHHQQPMSAEESVDMIQEVATSGEFALIIIDSVAAMVPEAELEADAGSSQVGKHARLMSQAMRKTNGALSKSGTAAIFINQTRIDVGVGPYGNPVTTTGGNALKFYASLRIEMSRSPKRDEGYDVVRAKMVKNKTAPPFQKTEVENVWGYGVDTDKDLLNLAVEEEVVSRKGAYYYFGETKLGQGADKAAAHLTEDSETKALVEAALQKKE